MTTLAAVVLSFATIVARDDVPAAPNPPLDVVATHPALASIARRIGGERVEVTTLCSPTGDVHAVQATPSILARLADADAFLHSGLDLELWVGAAVKGARNDKIKPGAAGNVDCSAGVEMLGVPSNPSRADGDVHVYGNPHYWLDPLNGKKIAATIAAAFTALDAGHAAQFAAARAAFDSEVNQKLLGWLKRALPFKGSPLVVYHDSFPYFLRRFGLTAVAFVEPKPRIPPTQSHLVAVLDTIAASNVRVIVREPYHDPDATEFLAAKSGAQVVTLAQFPGALDGANDYLESIGRNLDLVLGALESK
jgi:zinc/manganese transport system substrate-binding protein